MHYQLEKIENCRDLGGIQTKNGQKIKPNCLIRAGLLSSASENDINKLQQLHIKAIVDFRSSEEVREHPDIQIPQVDYYNLQANDENMQGVSREEKDQDLFIERITKASLKNPNFFKEYMIDCYRQLIRSQHSNQVYHQFLTLLAQPSYDCVLWHCTAGKDRTGIAAMFILEILGVDKATIYENYLETNRYLKDSMAPLFEFVQKLQIEDSKKQQIRESFQAALSASKEFIDAAYDEINKMANSVDEYLLTYVGVDQTLKEQLQKKFLIDKKRKTGDYDDQRFA